MAGVDFSDEKTAVAWLEMQSIEVRCAISSRAALRVVANIGLLESNLFSALAIAALRAILISAIRGSVRTSDVQGSAAVSAKVASSTATATANAAYPIESSSGAYTIDVVVARETAVASAFSAASAAVNATSAISAFPSAFSSARAANAAANVDVANKSISNFDTLLWSGIELPRTVEVNHHHFLELLAADRPTWGFWHDWYLAMWEGRFTDWNFALEVAKIPDDVWEKGAKAVAVEIDTIQTRRVLEAEIANLKDKLKIAQVNKTPPPIGHNNPPPDAVIDRQQAVGKEIILILDQLEGLENEIAKPDPSPSKLKIIAQTLWDISKRLTAYFGSLADVALQEASKGIGKIAAPAVVGYLMTTTAAQNEGVKAVANAIWDFVKTLPPG